MADKRAIWFASFVLLVFCLGGLIGFRVGTHFGGFPGDPDRPGGVARVGPDGFRRGGPGPGPRRGGPPPALPPDMLNQLTRELGLDAPQQEQLKKVLEERRDRLERVHQEARERFDAEQRDLFAAIRHVLRSDQQQAFDEFLQRRPQRGRRGGGPRDGGPRGGRNPDAGTLTGLVR
jgi:hypothetical protein